MMSAHVPTGPSGIAVAPLSFRRTLTSAWVAYPIRNHALVIRARRGEWTFEGRAYPDLTAAVAAANAYWADQITACLVAPPEARRAA